MIRLYFSSLSGSSQRNFYYLFPPILIFVCLLMALEVDARGYEDEGSERLRKLEEQQRNEELEQHRRMGESWSKALEGEEENLEEDEDYDDEEDYRVPPPRAEGKRRSTPMEKPEEEKLTRGWLGARVVDITPKLARSFNLETKDGALVLEVMPNSPAEKAGLQKGDVIVELGGEKIKDENKAADVLAQTPVGKKLKGKVLRQNKLVKFKARRLTSELSVGPSRPEPSESPSKPGGSARISALPSAIRFTTFTSPQGRFTVKIPEGWKFKSVSPDETWFGFTPKGKDRPWVGIQYLNVNDVVLRLEAARRWGVPPNQVTNEMLMAYIQQWANNMNPFIDKVPGFDRQMSAEDFLRKVLIPLMEAAIPNFREESINSKGPKVAELIYSGVDDKGIKYEEKLFCAMDSFYDQTAGWWNFAYINGTSTEPGKLHTVIPIATIIFQTFQPNERWLEEIRQTLLRGMLGRMHGQQVSTGMIAESFNRMRQMDYQMWQSEHQSLMRSGQGWADTLGGTQRLTDPRTDKTHLAPSGFKYYGLDGDKPVGTNDPMALKGAGITPLEPFDYFK